MSSNHSNIVYLLMLFVGLFFPTSINGMTQDIFYLVFSTVLFALYLFLPIKFDKKQVAVFLCINTSLWIFTAFASTKYLEFSYGIYPNFFLLSILYFLNLKNVRFTKLTYLFNICSFFLLALGFSVIFQFEKVMDYIKDYYIASYDDLVPNMLIRKKPVATFATHSVAAFFTFLFFYINIKYFEKTRLNYYLLVSILMMVLLLFIKSTTSILFLLTGFVILFSAFNKKRGGWIFFSIISIIIAFFLIESINTDSQNFFSILESENNGVSGRYSGDSPLKPTIDYILNNPLSPIGLAKPTGLYFSDSGFILYFLRGSFILSLGIYIGLYIFLKKNLTNSRYVLPLFMFILAFEMGYPLLINLRFLYFLPIIILNFNYLANYEAPKN